ncbi:hypothetical protein [Rhodococcus sp. Eu-32]|uniref:hypothetical protein n=1 Tax=Rhodococcus sp. Eu-32 TaxID=1017319 RepID=UPI001FB51CE5|nr:hypothetical protein [Rhodococcus sp. Eu-32]
MGAIISELPSSGWPAALFARRDALILVLASTGLPYSRIADMRICDVAGDAGAGSLRFRNAAGADIVTFEAVTASNVEPPQVLLRWLQVLGHNEVHPSARMLAETMASGDGTELSGYDRYVQSIDVRPLLTPIDRWGYLPLDTAALTARAVAEIVRAHLLGQAPPHVVPPGWARRENDAAETVNAGSSVNVDLDPGYYDRGIAARKNAVSVFADVEVLLGDIEERVEQLLAGLLDLVGEDEQ